MSAMSLWIIIENSGDAKLDARKGNIAVFSKGNW